MIVGEYVKAVANFITPRRRALAALLNMSVGNKRAGPREHA